jgi:hypothetical protein
MLPPFKRVRLVSEARVFLEFLAERIKISDT